MATQAPPHTTGLPSLDSALSNILAGDNIVWHVESIEDYQAFVTPFVQAAQRDGRRLIYFRFARHAPLIDPARGVETHTLDPEEGFENFIRRIHRIIDEAGLGTYYVFDCLTDLAVDWYSDAMLGNFFMLTCPYLFELQTVAYVGLLRHWHSRQATAPILDTTQLFLDVFRYEGTLHVRALKTQFRYSPTIHMLHAWKPDGTFAKVTSSVVVSQVLAVGGAPWAATDEHGDRAFSRAEEIVSSRGTVWYTPEQEAESRHQIVRAMVTRDPAMEVLVERHLRIEDLLDIRKRLVGSGLIGGKTVGMLVARRILQSALLEGADNLLEPHDSFYIGSDVFYTYLVRNKVRGLREKQRNPDSFLDGAKEARERIVAGEFPDYVLHQFEDMLDYFGQYPVIVRSSSLLEDNFGNAFAGKYDSVFCANQGPREQRLAEFVAAVKTVYASTMSEEALNYRARHGLLDRDEQMALLVMRVSGAMHGRCFYPHLAGVGFSYNPFPWSTAVDPAAGVVRLVFGLGTRAVDRVDDDYTRVVALNAPTRRPEAGFEEIVRHSQRHVDYIDLDAGKLMTGEFLDLVGQADDVPISIFASVDPHAESAAGHETWFLTFDRLLAETRFVDDARMILRTLEEAYGHPVDVEFSVNFLKETEYRLNLLQCRPLKVQGTGAVEVPEVHVAVADVVVAACGAVVGLGRVANVDRFIYVVPERYAELSDRDRHAIARVIGEINRECGRRGGTTMLVGPGRWGTSTPSLGVPVSFSEINHVNMLCELATMHAALTPDISLGTHFFNELVELNMLYFALFPGRKGNKIAEPFFQESPSRLAEYAPNQVKWESVVRVIEPTAPVTLVADPRRQYVVSYQPPRPGATVGSAKWQIPKSS